MDRCLQKHKQYDVHIYSYQVRARMQAATKGLPEFVWPGSPLLGQMSATKMHGPSFGMRAAHSGTRHTQRLIRRLTVIHKELCAARTTLVTNSIVIVIVLIRAGLQWTTVTWIRGSVIAQRPDPTKFATARALECRDSRFGVDPTQCFKVVQDRTRRRRCPHHRTPRKLYTPSRQSHLSAPLDTRCKRLHPPS